MRKFLIVTAVAATVPLVAAVIVQAAVTQSVEFAVKVVKQDRKKSKGGLTLRTTLRITDDAGAKPPPLTNTTLRFPKGAALNARYFRTCSESALQSKGPSGCPAASLIGRGTATGDARPILAAVKAKITMFNGQPSNGNPTILIYAQPEISSPLTMRGVITRQRSGPYGYILSVDVPAIPTLPGQPNASVSFFDATTLDKTVTRRGRKIHYIEGPILCHGTFFLLDGTFSYEGGITSTVYERFTLSGGPRCQ